MKELILFSEKYNIVEFDKKLLPCDIFNSEGAIVAKKSNSLPVNRLNNTYIYVDSGYSKDEIDIEDLDLGNDIEVKTEVKVETEVEVEVEPEFEQEEESHEDGYELSENYQEESGAVIANKLEDLEFEPLPKIKRALRSNVHSLKELFTTRIVNNAVRLDSANNIKISTNIANYIDSILDSNLFSSDYIDMINSIRNKDNYLTFSHSCSVSFYALSIAKKLKMLKEDLYLNNNMGRWRPMKTRNNNASGTLPFSNQMLAYTDAQRNNILVKYKGEVRDVLHEKLYDLMYEYLRIDRTKQYRSLLINFENPNRQNITMAAINLDIGKLAIPNSILNKRGKLTPEEFKIIEDHPLLSVVKLKEVGVNNPKMFAYILAHHILTPERGYPRVKQNTPAESKLIAIADIYDAMRSPKFYGKVYSQKETLDYIADLYREGCFDLPLYIAAVHTFEEYNHEYVRLRSSKVVNDEG